MYKNKRLKSDFGTWGTYQAVWGICMAFSRLKDKYMKQCDTVNKTTDSFTHYFSTVEVLATTKISMYRDTSVICLNDHFASHVDMDTNHKHLQV